MFFLKPRNLAVIASIICTLVGWRYFSAREVNPSQSQEQPIVNILPTLAGDWATAKKSSEIIVSIEGDSILFYNHDQTNLFPPFLKGKFNLKEHERSEKVPQDLNFHMELDLSGSLYHYNLFVISKDRIILEIDPYRNTMILSKAIFHLYRAQKK